MAEWLSPGIVGRTAVPGTIGAVQQVRPDILVALRNALTYIYWRKTDLKSFLRAAVGADLVARLDWSTTKRETVDQLVTYLEAHPSEYLEVLRKLVSVVASLDDFTHLEREEEGQAKVAEARRAVGQLRALVGTTFEADAAVATERRRVEATQREARRALSDGLTDLRARYFALLGVPPQERGRALEPLLRDVFELFDLAPRAAFALAGEQIDGHFTFEGTEYLLEAKWLQGAASRAELDAFEAKLRRKLDNTLGVFVAINGFSQPAIEVLSGVGSKLILFDGADLLAVLEDRLGLDDLIRRKKRHAAQTGVVFLPASAILTS